MCTICSSKQRFLSCAVRILSLQTAPYDVMRVDETLSESQLAAALAVTAMWTAAHAYSLLPYSCVILESIPEAEAVRGGVGPW